MKKIVWDHGIVPPVKDSILELLHDFVNQFLSGGYNGKLDSANITCAVSLFSM